MPEFLYGIEPNKTPEATAVGACSSANRGSRHESAVVPLSTLGGFYAPCMNWQLLGPLLVTTAVAIGGWFIGHALTKTRERQAEWRKEKLTHYKEYFTALAGVVGSHATDETRKRYAIAFNTVGLFASQEVIERLHAYQEITRLGAGEIPLAEHNRRLTRLVFAMRRDLRLMPHDKEETFSFLLISAQVSDQPPNKSPEPTAVVAGIKPKAVKSVRS